MPGNATNLAVLPLGIKGETAPAEVIAGKAETPLLLVCDHASNRVPSELQDLGLPDHELTRHIAWDIGAAEVTRELSRLMDATAVLCGVSRLVIDCNRDTDHPTSIPPISDGTNIPGNLDLTERERQSRAEQWLYPYHDEVSAQFRRLEEYGAVASLVAVHSFTPVMNGFVRPWQVGILWNRDPRIAVPLIQGLRLMDGLCVGDNEPYSGRDLGFTIDLHGERHGRPHVSIEIRQDLIADRAEAHAWAARLAALLRPILLLPENQRRARF